jgi:hypothetical protein
VRLELFRGVLDRLGAACIRRHIGRLALFLALSYSESIPSAYASL